MNTFIELTNLSTALMTSFNGPEMILSAMQSPIESESRPLPNSDMNRPNDSAIVLPAALKSLSVNFVYIGLPFESYPEIY